MNQNVMIAAGTLLLGGLVGYVAGSAGKRNSDRNSATDSIAPSKGARSVAPGDANPVRARKVMRFDEIMAEPGQTARLQNLIEYYSGLDPSEFEMAAEELEDLPFSQRIMAAFFLFSAWAEVAPEEALGYSDSMGMAGFFVKPTILQSWASSNPEGAAQYFVENQGDFRFLGAFGGPGRGGSNPAAQIAGEWARQDPVSALEWAQGLDGRNSDAAVAGVFEQIARDDPSRAAEMAAGLDGEARLDAFRSVAREWGGRNYGAAEEWIASLSPEEQDAARSQALRGLAGDNPRLAGEKIATLPEGAERDDAVGVIAQNWSREDPMGAAEWLMENGSEGAQGDAIRDVMVNWARQDSATARSWLDEQPAGVTRDRAAAAYVFSGTEEPGAAIQLAETIGDEGTRSRTIGMTTARWLQEDRDAAANYIETSESLSDEMRQRLLDRAGDSEGGRRGPPGGRGFGGP